MAKAPAEKIFDSAMLNIFARTDRLFGKLLILEYFAGILCSLFVSPLDDPKSSHYVLTAILVGGAVIALPLAFVRFAPGAPTTRHLIAISQMLISTLWIHLSGGRSESHFSVFGSLALIGFYRDWKVLATATITVAFDHILRGAYWPESIYGVANPVPWHWLEHIGWVLFEDTVLFLAARQSVREVRNTAERENRLQQSEKDYRTLFQLAGSGNWELDAKTTKVKRVNKKMCELFGYTEEEFLGMSLLEMVPEDERDDRMKVIHHAFSSGAKEWAAERRYKRKDGSIFWAMISAAFVRDQNGDVQSALATIQDITTIKSFEKELEVAKIRAEDANQAKTEFLANVSHEIRTPLGAMLGFTQIMLESHNANDEIKTHLTTILRNGQQLYRIIDDILDISKVEANQVEIRKTKFDLPEVIDDAISTLSQKAKEKNLILNVHGLSPLPDQVFSDPTRFRQVLLNIIGNSIKFTEKGQIDVYFQCHYKANKQSILEIRISDTGPGIPNEKREKLFRPFTQTDSATSRKYGGTGLGLYLGKRLANALGGDLVLEEFQPGLGCSFVVTVETGEVSPSNLIDLGKWKRSSPTTLNPIVPRCDGIKVLAIDDSRDNLLLTYRFLTSCGAIVECADSADKGLGILETHPFDVVIMDIQMPILDGYQAIRKLRARNYKKPVIALTAHAMVGERERCLQAGFDAYLVKPIDKAALVQAVRKYYLESQGWTETEPTFEQLKP